MYVLYRIDTDTIQYRCRHYTV